MVSIDRRRLVTAAGAIALAPLAARAAEEVRMYDYLFLDVEDRAAGLAETVRTAAGEISDAGGEVLGLFTPQLGWRASQGALLLGWGAGSGDRDAVVERLMAAPRIRGGVRNRLAPTVRPTAGSRPAPGGIHVHRWFVIDQASLPEFVRLSTQGWVDFEARFDTDIFGLFTAEPTPEDTAAGRTRLLLVTRYGDHGVWEASRDPSTEAMAAFLRRQRLTHDTWAASTLLAPL